MKRIMMMILTIVGLSFVGMCGEDPLSYGADVNSNSPLLSVFSEGDGVSYDVEVQAEFLQGLGLFAGTEKGFELERQMTRCEGAVMVVKFMGAQQEALAGTWKTPFTDVPKWAEPYVGWLYHNKITAGVSGNRFGSQEPVTAWQYCVFLSKALQGDMDLYRQIANQYTVENTKKFMRKDAVALSCKALFCQYSRAENKELTAAQFLVSEGAFTMGQLRKEGWKAVQGHGTFFGLDESEELTYAGDEGMLIQSSDENVLTIRWVDTDTLEEKDRYQVTGTVGGGGAAHWKIAWNPNYEGIFNGGGGLYQQRDGRLCSLSDLAAMDVKAVRGGSWIVITGPQSGQWAGRRDIRAEIISVDKNGKITPLLTQGMERQFYYLYFADGDYGVRDAIFPIVFEANNMGGGSQAESVSYKLMDVDRVAVVSYGVSPEESSASRKAAIEKIKDRLRQLGILYE